jgi:hypothetical protein
MERQAETKETNASAVQMRTVAPDDFVTGKHAIVALSRTHYARLEPAFRRAGVSNSRTIRLVKQIG